MTCSNDQHCPCGCEPGAWLATPSGDFFVLMLYPFEIKFHFENDIDFRNNILKILDDVIINNLNTLDK